jgi:fluoroquinolone transport system permease protein
MIRFNHFIIDLKQILRDPVMAILTLAPLMLIIALKLAVVHLPPLFQSLLDFDIAPYLVYVLVFVVMMCGALPGIVTGFMMMDDRDGKIAELMSVTPLGRTGYLINRLLFAATLSVLYSIISYYVLNVVELPFLTVIFVSLQSASYSIIIGLLIFLFADDKVKGLTFAKAINSLSLFAFTDFLTLNWLTVLSWFFPPYWITVVVLSPLNFSTYALAFLVNSAWLLSSIYVLWIKDPQI